MSQMAFNQLQEIEDSWDSIQSHLQINISKSPLILLAHKLKLNLVKNFKN